MAPNILSRRFEKFFSHKCLISIITIAFIFMASWFIETYYYHSDYFTFSENNRSISNISESQIQTIGIDYSDGIYTVIDPNASITIQEDLSQVDGIELQSLSSNEPYTLKAVVYNSKGEPVEEILNNVAPTTGSLVRFQPQSDGTQIVLTFQVSDQIGAGVTGVQISELKNNNQIVFNLIRFFLIALTLSIIAILLINYKYLTTHLPLMFLIIALSFGILFAFLIPVHYGYDEREHFIKSYQTASFDFTSTSSELTWPEEYSQFSKILSGRDVSSNNYKEFLSFMDYYGSDHTLQNTQYETTASTYLFFPYIFSALGIQCGILFRMSMAGIFYMGRVFNVIFFSLIIFFILKNAKFCKRTIFVVALLPAVFYCFCTYSADQAALVSGLGLVTAFLNMLGEKDAYIKKKDLISYIVFGCFLIVTKVPYFPLTFLILVIPSEKFNFRRRIFRYFKWILCVLFILLAGASYLYSASLNLNQWQVPGVNINSQIKYILSHPLTYMITFIKLLVNSGNMLFNDTVAFMAYSGYLGNGLTLFIVFYMFYIAISDEPFNISTPIEIDIKRMAIYKAVLFLTILMSWLLVCTALYLTFCTVGSPVIIGVQGRYFAPLMFPFLCMIQSDKLRSSYSSQRINAVIYICSTGFLVLTAIKIFLKFLA